MTIQIGGGAPAIGIRSSVRNLKVSRTSVTVVRVEADEIILLDANNNPKFLASVDISPDITVSGAGGLDTGAEAANTWYYLWVIGKSDGTKSAILSASATAPTMPSGYDFKGLVSAVRNDGSSNFINFLQQGREYAYSAWQLMDSGSKVITAWTTVDTTPFVPATLSTFIMMAWYPGGVNSILTNDSTDVANITTYEENKTMERNYGGDNINRVEYNILTANTIYWSNDGGALSKLWCRGFRINKI